MSSDQPLELLLCGEAYWQSAAAPHAVHPQAPRRPDLAATERRHTIGMICATRTTYLPAIDVPYPHLPRYGRLEGGPADPARHAVNGVRGQHVLGPFSDNRSPTCAPGSSMTELTLRHQGHRIGRERALPWPGFPGPRH